MKPFIIYVDGDNNKIILTKEEFEKTLNEVYKQGHEDGYNKGLAQVRSYPDWWNTPQITANGITYNTASQPKPNPITITCKNDNDRNLTAINDAISNLLNSVGD